MSELSKKQRDAMQMTDQNPQKSSVDLFRDESEPKQVVPAQAVDAVAKESDFQTSLFLNSDSDGDEHRQHLDEKEKEEIKKIVFEHAQYQSVDDSYSSIGSQEKLPEVNTQTQMKSMNKLNNKINKIDHSLDKLMDIMSHRNKEQQPVQNVQNIV